MGKQDFDQLIERQFARGEKKHGTVIPTELREDILRKIEIDSFHAEGEDDIRFALEQIGKEIDFAFLAARHLAPLVDRPKQCTDSISAAIKQDRARRYSFQVCECILTTHTYNFYSYMTLEYTANHRNTDDTIFLNSLYHQHINWKTVANNYEQLYNERKSEAALKKQYNRQTSEQKRANALLFLLLVDYNAIHSVKSYYDQQSLMLHALRIAVAKEYWFSEIVKYFTRKDESIHAHRLIDDIDYQNGYNRIKRISGMPYSDGMYELVEITSRVTGDIFIRELGRHISLENTKKIGFCDWSLAL